LGITGAAFNIGAGFRAASNPVKERYKPGAEIKAEQARLKVEKARKDAQPALDAGGWSAAVERYTRIITESPNDAAPYFGRSEAYPGAKDYDAAVRDFNKGAELGKYLPAIGGHQVKWRQ
jgi:tetratricopeptide (TPR) repeat protein